MLVTNLTFPRALLAMLALSGVSQAGCINWRNIFRSKPSRPTSTIPAPPRLQLNVPIDGTPFAVDLGSKYKPYVGLGQYATAGVCPVSGMLSKAGSPRRLNGVLVSVKGVPYENAYINAQLHRLKYAYSTLYPDFFEHITKLEKICNDKGVDFQDLLDTEIARVAEGPVYVYLDGDTSKQQKGLAALLAVFKRENNRVSEVYVNHGACGMFVKIWGNCLEPAEQDEDEANMYKIKIKQRAVHE